MKYLEYTPFDRINDFLSSVNLGDRTIKGCLEAYSCKHTGTDKKLSFSLENEILGCLGNSLYAGVSSPLESLFSGSSRKTLIYLLLSLYHMYPDYDFSAVRAYEFFTEESWESFKQIFYVYMFEASKEWLDENEGGHLLATLYRALDEVVKLAGCEIYSYNPGTEADPFLEEGAIWSFHFFFYNKSHKRIQFGDWRLLFLVKQIYGMLRYLWHGQMNLYFSLSKQPPMFIPTPLSLAWIV